MKALLLTLLCGVGCASALVVPTVDEARAAGVSLGELERGRALYAARCAGCHELHLPGERAPAEWPKIVREMRDNAGLTFEDSDLVARYLSVASQSHPMRPKPAM